MPVGDALIDALQALLDVHPKGEDVPSLGYIDGALAELLLSPEPVPSAEWLPLLGVGGDAGFARPEDDERFAELLRQRQAEIAAELLAGGLAFAPLYDLDEDGYPAWQLWLLGLFGAMALRRESWEPLFVSLDEDLAAASLGVISLGATLPGIAAGLPEEEQFDDLEELAEGAPDLLPYFVETIYRCQRGLPRVVLTEGWEDEGVPVGKVGRNAPCPCGSGKKYKKCCGR